VGGAGGAGMSAPPTRASWKRDVGTAVVLTAVWAAISWMLTWEWHSSMAIAMFLMAPLAHEATENGAGWQTKAFGVCYFIAWLALAAWMAV